MAIVFPCTCGKPLRAKDDAAGKKTKCPFCAAVVTIPAASVPVKSQPAPAVAGTAGVGEPLAIDLAWPSNEPTPAAASPGAGETVKGEGSSGGFATEGNIDAALDASRPTDGSKQYKVLMQKDLCITGKLNPAKMMEVLNAHALKGWTVKSAVVITVPGHAGSHDEIVVIMER